MSRNGSPKDGASVLKAPIGEKIARTRKTHPERRQTRLLLPRNRVRPRTRLVSDPKRDDVASQRAKTSSGRQLRDRSGVNLERSRVARHDLAQRLERRVLAEVGRCRGRVHKVRRDYSPSAVVAKRQTRPGESWKKEEEAETREWDVQAPARFLIRRPNPPAVCLAKGEVGSQAMAQS